MVSRKNLRVRLTCKKLRVDKRVKIYVLNRLILLGKLIIVKGKGEQKIMKAKIGRPLHFPTTDALIETFEAYKAWAKENPWCKEDFIKSGPNAGEKVYLTTERPLTEVEFAVFCGMSLSGLQEYTNREPFSGIYRAIKAEMSSQRISGGLANAYNGNLVARIDGLTEKTEVTQISVAGSLAEARKRASNRQDTSSDDLI